MKPLAVIIAAVLGCLFGLSVAPAKVTKLPGETITVEKPVDRPVEVIRTVTTEDRTKIESLQVQIAELTAELEKARQRPEALPATATAACATVPPKEAAVLSQAPRRFRIFGRRR